jgi:predicted exporter
MATTAGFSQRGYSEVWDGDGRSDAQAERDRRITALAQYHASMDVERGGDRVSLAEWSRRFRFHRDGLRGCSDAGLAEEWEAVVAAERGAEDLAWERGQAVRDVFHP